jgi:hypothetical protein
MLSAQLWLNTIQGRIRGDLLFSKQERNRIHLDLRGAVMTISKMHATDEGSEKYINIQSVMRKKRYFFSENC